MSSVSRTQDYTEEISTTTSTGLSRETMIDRKLMKAAITGDSQSMMDMAKQDPSVLLGTTPQGNTCLHISSLHGHEGFCKDVSNESLLAVANSYGETPLFAAVTNGHASLASYFLERCCALGMSDAILKQDKDGCNALHHAVRSGHKDIALKLIAAEPNLSQVVNKFNETPMYIAVMRGFVEVFEKLLELPNSAHTGAYGYNALHAAVRNGNSGIAKKIMEKRPQLAREAAIDNATPMLLAVIWDKVDVLRVMLEHDWSLGFVVSTDDGTPLLTSAAARGHIGVARELLDHCPDTPYCDAHGWTCLHEAAKSGHTEFVEFILREPQFRKLVNMRDRNGKTALHLAVQKCNPKIVAALLFHKDIDFTMVDIKGNTAASELGNATDDAKTINWMIATASTDSQRQAMIDRRLRKAAITGDSQSMNDMASQDPSVLLGTTPHGNTCLHISSLHGHEGFCKDVLMRDQSLLTIANSYGETPLLTAVTSGHASLASDFLRHYRALGLSEAILKQDKDGCNALHLAIRSSHKDIALELIAVEPTLSQCVNKLNESPMYIAVMRDFVEVFEKLLEVPNSAHTGHRGYNALHAAVRNGNSGIAENIMRRRPWLAREENISYNTPMQLAVIYDKVDVLRVMLKHDLSLGSIVSTDKGIPLLNSAAFRGHVGVARELLGHFSDTPYRAADGWTCLHSAVYSGHTEFVEFILREPQLRKLVNMRDGKGKTALHYAVRKCNPKIVAALLFHKGIDLTIQDHNGSDAAWQLMDVTDHAKTLNWNEVSMLMSKADPRSATIYNLHVEAKGKVTNESRKDIKSLTQTYTNNTSLVAILIATITFAAAFTLPGGYSTDSGSEGLPIMTRKFAFQAFLISDTIAMCSSLVVAYTCILGRWEDLEFLHHYKSFTQKLMWFAYIATTTAFATGLYTVLAPRLPWFAIAICFLPVLLPVLAKLLGEWPILKLRIRLGQTFKSGLLDMV